MFKRIVMLLWIALLTVSAGCSKQKNDRTALVVGFDAEFPPYGYLEKGEAKGFDIDLAREVCRRNDWKFIPKPIAWAEKDIEIKKGKIDCVWSCFSVMNRESSYELTAPYAAGGQAVTVLKKSPIRRLTDLKDKAVAVLLETPVYAELSPAGQLEDFAKSFRVLVVCNDYAEAFQKLENGSVDAVISNIGIAQKRVIENLGKYAILKEILLPDQYGVGFKKGNRQLCEQVEKTLREMVADGTAAKISARYFDGRNVMILQP